MTANYLSLSEALSDQADQICLANGGHDTCASLTLQAQSATYRMLHWRAEGASALDASRAAYCSDRELTWRNTALAWLEVCCKLAIGERANTHISATIGLTLSNTLRPGYISDCC